MNANELSFGIEIETCVGLRKKIDIGGYHDGRQVRYLPAGWTASYDSSIRPGPFQKGAEIASPVLKSEGGIREVVKVVEILKREGHKTNESCSVHVHVQFDPNWPAEKMAKLISTVSYIEKGIYASTDTKARENGRWCNGVRQHGNGKTAKDVMDQTRYSLLNIKNLVDGRIPTVEFRAFSGSLNPVKIVGWIQLCLGVVERAINAKSSPAWEPRKVSGTYGLGPNAGQGQVEIERLFAFLRWGKEWDFDKKVFVFFVKRMIHPSGDLVFELFRLSFCLQNHVVNVVANCFRFC